MTMKQRDKTIMDLAKIAARTELEALAARSRQITDAFGAAIMDGLREAAWSAKDDEGFEAEARPGLGERHADHRKKRRVAWQMRPENAAKVVAWKRKMRKAARARAASASK